MAIPQPSKRIYDQLLEKVKKQDDFLSSLKKMMDAFNLDFWGGFRERLEAKAKIYANDRESHFMELTEIQLKVLKAREDELRRVISMPDDLMGSYKALLEEAAQTKIEAKEYSKRLQSAGV